MLPPDDLGAGDAGGVQRPILAVDVVDVAEGVAHEQLARLAGDIGGREPQTKEGVLPAIRSGVLPEALVDDLAGIVPWIEAVDHTAIVRRLGHDPAANETGHFFNAPTPPQFPGDTFHEEHDVPVAEVRNLSLGGLLVGSSSGSSTIRIRAAAVLGGEVLDLEQEELPGLRDAARFARQAEVARRLGPDEEVAGGLGAALPTPESGASSAGCGCRPRFASRSSPRRPEVGGPEGAGEGREGILVGDVAEDRGAQIVHARACRASMGVARR